jgi:hypothetical protein
VASYYDGGTTNLLKNRLRLSPTPPSYMYVKRRGHKRRGITIDITQKRELVHRFYLCLHGLLGIDTERDSFEYNYRVVKMYTSTAPAPHPFPLNKMVFPGGTQSLQ